MQSSLLDESLDDENDDSKEKTSDSRSVFSNNDDFNSTSEDQLDLFPRPM